MNNPLGWLCGFVWLIAFRIHKRLHPGGGRMWMPMWIQPYWMRCMGWEVNDDLLSYMRSRQ